MIKFRSTLAASSMLLLTAGAASAADLYSGGGGSLKDDTPVNYRACNGARFAGGYVGATLGDANLHSKWTENSDMLTPAAGGPATPYPDVFLGSHTENASGLTGGLETGYNFVRCNFLLGVETDYNFANVGKTSVYTSPIDGSGVGITNGMKDFVTMRLRMGVVSDRTLYYVTGGLAWADLHHALSDNYPATSGAGLGSVHYGINGTAPDYNDWKLGWALGGGFETALTERVSFKGEALYMGFGSRNYSFTDQGALFGKNSDTYSFTNKEDAFVARVGLNVKLGELSRGCDNCAPLK